MAANRQQTASEGGLQNLVNLLSRELGVTPPRVSLRDGQYFSYQQVAEHRLAEYLAEERTLFINPEMSFGSDSIPPESLFDTLSKLHATSDVTQREVIRHHLVHVSLCQRGIPTMEALSHGPVFLKEAARLSVSPFALTNRHQAFADTLTSASESLRISSEKKLAETIERNEKNWRWHKKVALTVALIVFIVFTLLLIFVKPPS